MYHCTCKYIILKGNPRLNRISKQQKIIREVTLKLKVYSLFEAGIR